MLRVPSLILTLALLAMAAPAQRLLFEHRGTTTWGLMGHSVAFVGDVDKDGYEDYAVGEPSARNARKLRTGSVHVFSGQNGRRIHLFFGDAIDDLFGLAVSAGGDVNRDGYPDLLVGAPGSILHKYKGYARVLSGKDGKVLHTFSGSQVRQGYGWSVAPAGDLDKDGHDDIIVGSNGSLVPSRVWVRSGKDGSVLRSWQGTWPGGWFGFNVAGGVDLNGDGFAEVLVAAPMVGSIHVMDGRSGTTLYTFKQNVTSQHLGAGGVAFAGDVNRDGVPDIAMSWPTFDKARRKLLGAVRVYSGKLLGGKPLYTWIGGPDEHLGGGGPSIGMGRTSVAGAGDVNRDGHADILVGMASTAIARLYSGKDGRVLYTFANKWGLDPGTAVAGGRDIDRDGYPDLLVGNGFCSCKTDESRAQLFSGLDSLLASQPSLSISRGGIQRLSLDAGPGQAGNPYLVLGSMSGTHPGIRLGSVILPLRLDAYTFLSLQYANIPPFLKTLGLLDRSGKAQAVFVMPRGLPPSLAGLELNHAFVTSGRPGRFDFASNAAPLGFVK